MATLGILLPALVSTLRFIKYRHWIQVSNYLALALVILGLPQEINNVIAVFLLLLLVASFLLKTEPYISKNGDPAVIVSGAGKKGKNSKTSSIKKSASSNKAKKSQDPSPKITQRANEIPKPPKDKTQKGFLHYFFIGRAKEKKLRSKIALRTSLTGSMLGQSELFEQIIKNTKWNFETTNSEEKLIDFAGCNLIEARKGTRVTERNSTSSGRGYVGVRVGPVFVGGSGSSSSYSQSVSYPAPDVLQHVDTGTFIVSTRKISFAGGMFAKSTDFKKIVDYNTNGSTILIAPSTGTKVWICRLPSVADQWVVSALIEVAGQSSERKLSNTSKYMDVMNVREAFKSSVNYRRAEIKVALEDYAQQKHEFESELRSLRAIYGSRIKA